MMNKNAIGISLIAAGIISAIIGFYLLISFDYSNIGVNYANEACVFFGVFQKIICDFVRAINFFIACIFIGLGYAVLVFGKNKLKNEPYNQEGSDSK